MLTILACTEVIGTGPGREFCHILNSIEKNLAAAETTCQGLGYDLLTINTPAESAEFASNLATNQYQCLVDL